MSHSSSHTEQRSLENITLSVKAGTNLNRQISLRVNVWYCHCCSAKNVPTVENCRVCGRPESYALPGYPLPFHGQTGKLYRPSQLMNVLDDIHETDSEQWTALHSACANGNTTILRRLLEYKSEIEAITDKGHRPIHLAVFSGNLDCVHELIKRNADINVATYEEKATPLHMACKKGYAKIAQLLIQHGANIHAKDLLQRTPLHSCAVSGRSDIALLLLRSGAELNCLDIHGWEACQIAELNNHRELQELLVREGMTNEKQAVFKELPPAKWHNDVWFEVVKLHSQKKINFQREREFQSREERKLKDFQQGLIEEQKQQQANLNKEMRKKEIEMYQQQLERQKNNKYNLALYQQRQVQPSTNMEVALISTPSSHDGKGYHKSVI